MSSGKKGVTVNSNSSFPCILSNEIQTMFSQLSKRSSKVLTADLCADHALAQKKKKQALTVLRRNKIMAVGGGTVSHYFILVIRKFIDFMLFSNIVCVFFF